MTDVRARLSRGLRTRDHDVVQRRRRRVLAAGGVVGALGALYLMLLITGGDGIPRGTTVLDVEIGGMTAEQATETLDRALLPRADKAIPVHAGDVNAEVVPARAGLSLDVPATVEAAGGRTWNPLALVGRLVAAPQVAPVVVVDQPALDAQVAAIAADVDDPPVEPRIRYSGLQPELKEGRDGTGIDRAAAAESLRSAFLVSDGTVDLPIVTLPRAVGPEAAREVASGAAVTAVSAPVTVQVDSTTLALSPEQLAAATTFRVVDGALVPVADGAALHADLEPGLAGLETPGRDARIVIVSGEPVVKPSREGRGVADDELASAVVGAMTSTDERVATVAIGQRPPALTTEQAEALNITERLSTFTQSFPYAAYRVQNIGQAAKYVNGTILRPGETFSMNDTIKERTPENGYTEGFVVGPGGVFEEALGGGVSAATTTVWTAAFYAGLERVSTRAHSIWISRYTAGLEATIAWGQFDMQFRNDTPDGVLITASTTNTSMTVSMWGTRQYDEVDAEFGERTGIREFQTVYDESDDCLSQYGVDGFTIDVDRVFYRDGEEVDRETITTSYNPSPTVVCGPDPATVEKTKSPKPSESGSDGEPSGEPSPSDTSPTPKPSPKASAERSGSGRSGPDGQGAQSAGTTEG